MEPLAGKKKKLSYLRTDCRSRQELEAQIGKPVLPWLTFGQHSDLTEVILAKWA